MVEKEKSGTTAAGQSGQQNPGEKSNEESGAKPNSADTLKVDAAELSEEDRQLKEDLELLVARLREPNPDLYLPSLEQLRRLIRSATTSMTSVPKPLKFLREYYQRLKTLHEAMPTDDTRRFAADIVSILAMTMPPDQLQAGESLEFRLKGSREDIGSWGHEYVRHISGEIAQRWSSAAPAEREQLLTLVHSIVPYHMAHNAEAEAVDLLMDIEQLQLIEQYIDNEDVAQRVCLYNTSCVCYVPDPENTNLLKTSMQIFLKFGRYPDALRVAMQLNDVEQVKQIIHSCPDESVKQQLAFMVGRQQIFLNDDNLDTELIDIMSNTQLNKHFLNLGRELDILEPKTPEDIYKAHLENGGGRGFLSGSGAVDSARVNLAASFVNGLVNCGFGKDKLLRPDDGKWLYKNKDHGMISAAASLGLILLWNVDEGLTVIDKYLYTNDDNIKAGALLACGIVNCGVRNDCDPALALLSEYLTNPSQQIRVGAILGIGLAYAGSNREDVIATLLPLLSDSKQPVEVHGVVAICCGLIAVGSANSDVVTPCLQLLMERDSINKLEIKNDPLLKYIPLAIALCYLGRQDTASTIQEALDVITNVGFKRICKHMLEICAYAATGNVLQIQNLLLVCSERIGEAQEKISGDQQQKGKSDTSAASSSSASSSASASASASSSASSTNSSSSNIAPEYRNAEQAICTLGIALIAMAEPIGSEMAFRTFGHLLRYGDSSIKKAVPLALALTSISNPKINILETLSKFSHDSDTEVACNAIFAMGLVGAGTNNARLATMLRQLATFHSKEANCLFMIRIAQGLTHLGKGTLTLSPFHSDRQLLVPTNLAGLLIVLFTLLDSKQTILSKQHYLLYFLTASIQPRMLITFDKDLNPLPVTVRVGQAVDIVGQAGKPKTITGFQTHTTPVLLAIGERAELATDEYIALTPVLEGFVILKKNPNFSN